MKPIIKLNELRCQVSKPELALPSRTQELRHREVTKRKAAERKKKHTKANQVYVNRHLEEVNRRARDRMAKRRAEMTETQKQTAKAKQQQYSRKSYLRNKSKILRRAHAKRQKEYIEKHGEEAYDEFYPKREVQPRHLLGEKDDSTEMAVYEQEYRRWKKQKAIQKALDHYDEQQDD
ncbi:hypothetical protein V5O48_014449 [Marasmius crinis-equi]|uniref:Uncharacterized protein n=1 Tax=Marasmius crinis-equi TaxID=585013 RepID=A0ABR3EXB3_9AGAR